jgi:hypothetical protein
MAPRALGNALWVFFPGDLRLCLQRISGQTAAMVALSTNRDAGVARRSVYAASDHLGTVNAFEQWSRAEMVRTTRPQVARPFVRAVVVEFIGVAHGTKRRPWLRLCVLSLSPGRAATAQMWEGHSFAQENFVSGSTMKTIQGLRRQLERNLTEIGGVIASNLRGAPVCTPEEAIKLSRSVLAAGLPSNVARTEVMRESKSKGKTNAKKSYRYKIGVATAGDSGRCWIHPTSVLSEKELPDATQVKF